MCVCVCVCFIEWRMGKWVVVRLHAGEGICGLFMFAASQCSHLRKQEFMCVHGLSGEVWISGVCEDGALHTWTLQWWQGAKHNRTGQNMGAQNTSTVQTTRDFRKFWEMQHGFMKWKWNGTKTQDLRKHKTEKHDRSQEYKISDDRLSVRRRSKILENKTLRQGFGKHSRIKENIAF